MADATASPLVLTKLRVPTPRPRLVPRAHLVERLTQGTRAGLVLVCAPAGYGKSTLLAEWAAALLNQGSVVAWYALDASDDAPMAFGAYLVATLAQALVPLPDLVHSAQRLRSSAEIDLLSILPLVINAVVTSGQDCVLVLDDYHLIASPIIHGAIAYLLDHLPENMRLAIGSRADPPLPLARLRVRCQLREMRAADLRFTEAETTAFLNGVMRLALSPETVTALEVRTEGWIAGLQLAALSLSGRSGEEGFLSSFTGSHRHLVDYLLEEVMGRQPEGVQRFLLSTSVLERMCGPLCDDLLGETSGSAALLEQLEQANLFVVALDDHGEWYRYHHLFRDFLQARLSKTRPEQVVALHRAASRWYAAHDLLREAAQHAFQTRDWEYAAAFVEQHSFTMIVHSEISTIAEWCAALPEAVMQAHPMLCIHQCWAWVFSFRRQNRGRIEARLHQAEQAIAQLKNGQVGRELAEVAAVVRTFMAMAPDPTVNPQEHLALAKKTLEAYPSDDTSRFSSLLTVGYIHLALQDARAAAEALEAARQIALRERLYFGVVESSFHWARLAHSQGALERAAEICRQGQADIAAMLSHPEQELPALGCLDIALGCVRLEQNHLAEAEQKLAHGLDLLGIRTNPYYLLTARAALFRLNEIQGRPAEAEAHLARLEETWPDIAFYTGGLRVEHALRTAPEDARTLADAAAWCQTFSASLGENVPLLGMGPFGAAEAYYLAYLTWARAQIALGQARASRTYLEQRLNQARAQGLKNRVIELSLLEALAWRAEGEDQRALEALEEAVLTAKPEGYLRSFDQGPALSGLLVEAAGRGFWQDDIERILNAIGRSLASDPESTLSATIGRVTVAARPEMAEALSGRELEVLRLMARGASNQGIAGQLVITVGTVKSHINHILMKLEVHNRTEAVARARELGLL
jgi:LuxR family transcriptional regulator, maltose regulon positive regulatory protein